MPEVPGREPFTLGPYPVSYQFTEILRLKSAFDLCDFCVTILGAIQHPIRRLIVRSRKARCIWIVSIALKFEQPISAALLPRRLSSVKVIKSFNYQIQGIEIETGPVKIAKFQVGLFVMQFMLHVLSFVPGFCGWKVRLWGVFFLSIDSGHIRSTPANERKRSVGNVFFQCLRPFSRELWWEMENEYWSSRKLQWFWTRLREILRPPGAQCHIRLNCPFINDVSPGVA